LTHQKTYIRVKWNKESREQNDSGFYTFNVNTAAYITVQLKQK